jgi:hypothetical protein
MTLLYFSSCHTITSKEKLFNHDFHTVTKSRNLYLNTKCNRIGSKFVDCWGLFRIIGIRESHECLFKQNSR